jgi:hypothetical protein
MVTNEDTMSVLCLSEFLSHPLTSVLIGAVITWLVAWFYYKRAGNEFRQEAAFLHQSSNAIISFLENHGADIQVQRNDAGRITGLVVGVVGKASGSSMVEGRSG